MQARLRCAMSKNLFNKEWEQLFLFVENNDGDPVCMVCDYNAKRNHRHTIERHYNTCQKKCLHKNLDRATLVDDLKLKFQNKNLPINQFQYEKDIKQKIPFVVALALAKHCKPFEDGVFF